MIAPFHGEFTVTQSYSPVHKGIDLYAQDSPAVYAVTEGEAIFVGCWNNGLGTQVWVKSGEYVWYYGHLSATTVRQSHRVKAGEQIGVQGNTGNSKGSHLHLAVVGRNGYENPASLLDLPTTTIGEPLYYTPTDAEPTVPAIVLSQSPKQIKVSITISGIEYKGTLRSNTKTRSDE